MTFLVFKYDWDIGCNVGLTDSRNIFVEGNVKDTTKTCDWNQKVNKF